MQITDFEVVRRDGRVLPHPIDPVSFAKLGWKPDKTIEARWKWSGTPVSLKGEHGIWPHIVHGGWYIAALVQLAPDPDRRCRLVIYNGNGSVRHVVPTQVPTLTGPGWVEWVEFESMKQDVEGVFGAIGEEPGGQMAYFINADTGAIRLRGESR